MEPLHILQSFLDTLRLTASPADVATFRFSSDLFVHVDDSEHDIPAKQAGLSAPDSRLVLRIPSHPLLFNHAKVSYCHTRGAESESTASLAEC